LSEYYCKIIREARQNVGPPEWIEPVARMLESVAMRLRWFSLSLALLPVVALAVKPVQDTTKTVWNGVYTDAQAAQGRGPYEESCSRCHAADLSGAVGNSLKGDVFIRDWGGKTVGALYERIKTTMPRGAPRSLSDGAYLNIVAYILQANGFPPDPMAELKADLLQSIRVESKEGPGYVPNGALVDAVGCLTQNSTRSGFSQMPRTLVECRRREHQTRRLSARQLQKKRAKASCVSSTSSRRPMLSRGTRSTQKDS